MRLTTRIRLLMCLLSAVAVLQGNLPAALGADAPALAPPEPPAQPASGPGGAAVLYDRVIATRHGRAPVGYWLFEPSTPADPDRADRKLPLVLFVHGFNALDPTVYRAWIDHIVRRGAIVVYPDYQDVQLVGANPLTYLGNLLTGVRAATAELKTGRHPPIDLARAAVVGHSRGGILAANYAAVAEAQGLPLPAVLMPVEPGGCRGCGGVSERLGAPLAPLDTVPAGVLALVVVGSEDDVVGTTGGKLIWSGLEEVPLDQRDFVTLVSDDHGRPPLEADHQLPQTDGLGSRVDAMDWYGSWKLFDALTSCAFEERWCDTALGNSDSQRFMGVWSDGMPVAAARITDDPGPPVPS